MLCNSCNKMINDDMKFCPYCGTETGNGGERVPFALKSEIDKSMERKNFDLVWNEILNKNNAYAEYKYEKFFHDVVRDVQNIDDFKAVTKKILYYGKNGCLYAVYLYGMALIWSYEERDMLKGRDFLGGYEQVTQGEKFVLEMAQRGQISAQATVGMWYKNGEHGCLKNDIKSYKLLKSAADKLHPTAMYELGVSYQNGELGLRQNADLADTYMERAAYFGFYKAKGVLKDHILVDNKRQQYISSIVERYKPLLSNLS